MISRPERVLVVEDEEAIAEGLRLNLSHKGYEVVVVRDGLEAIKAAEEVFDLILLDIRLPKLDGFQVCQRLRGAGNLTPILMLTARNHPDDIVQGLKLGADDYVVKPFDLAELLARIEGILRRRAWANGISESPLSDRYEFGDYWVDFKSWQAQTRHGITALSKKEISVMRLFAERPGVVISRRELLAKVWELPNHPNTRVVDNVIVALRKAFEESAAHPEFIHNVRGVGYRFTPQTTTSLNSGTASFSGPSPEE